MYNHDIGTEQPAAAMEVFAPEKLALLRQVLEVGKRRIVITTHHKPDADALGSSLGLARYLTMLGHAVTVVTPTDFPHFLDWMSGQEQVLVFDPGGQPEAARLVAEADLIFCLDFSTLSRINELGQLVAASSAFKVMIDHHQEPEAFADLQFWQVSAAATSELVCLLIDALGDGALIDGPMADCLYAGIMTDTGSFRHASTTARVHRTIAALIDRGADNVRVHRLIYDNNTENRLRFLGFCLSEKMIVLPEYRVAYISISAEELKRYNVATGDSEGIVNYALSIQGVVFAAIIIDRTEAVKISFRSAGDFDVNRLARDHFDGGGHRNAAGGKSQDTLEKTVERFLAILPSYSSKLHSVIKS